MNISEMWILHSESRFPKGYGGRDVNGICVTSIDTYVSGCVSSYMRYDNKSIDVERHITLQNSKNDLEKVLPYLEEEAREYFERLYEMCCVILKEAVIA